MEGLWKGLHRSPFHGFSVEFSEYRPYVRGDDPRHMDWKLAGRSGRYFVKKFEDETNLRCQMMVDHSGSMRFGSARSMAKSEYAATLAATLALFLMKQGDAVGVTTFAAGVAEHVPARNRPGHLRRLMLELERPVRVREGGTALDVSMTQLSELLRKKGLVCVFSDLLAPVERLERQLAWLGSMGQDVVMFHLMDRAEIEFRFEEAAVFEDAETGVERFVNPGEAREGYLARLKAHCEAVRAGCERAGVDYHWCPTDRPLEEALFEFVSRRDRVKGVKKRAGGGGR